jgi:hypothetical protein
MQPVLRTQALNAAILHAPTTVWVPKTQCRLQIRGFGGAGRVFAPDAVFLTHLERAAVALAA